MLAALQAWLAQAWPWRPGAVAFPGQIQSWEDWAGMASAAGDSAEKQAGMGHRSWPGCGPQECP